MATVNMCASLIRAVAPLVLGPLHDSDADAPFLTTGAAGLVPLMCALLLRPRVPSDKPAGSAVLTPAGVATPADPREDSEEPQAEPAPAAALWERLEVGDLPMAYEHVAERHRRLERGDDLGGVDDAGEPSTEDVEELGRCVCMCMCMCMCIEGGSGGARLVRVHGMAWRVHVHGMVCACASREDVVELGRCVRLPALHVHTAVRVHVARVALGRSYLPWVWQVDVGDAAQPWVHPLAPEQAGGPGDRAQRLPPD